MTRSFKTAKELPKSGLLMASANHAKAKKDGAGKYSWGRERDLIEDAKLDAYDPNYMPGYNAQPNLGRKISTVSLDEDVPAATA